MGHFGIGCFGSAFAMVFFEVGRFAWHHQHLTLKSQRNSPRTKRIHTELQTRLRNLCKDILQGRKSIAEFLVELATPLEVANQISNINVITK